MKKTVLVIVFSALLWGQTFKLLPFFHHYELFSPYGTYGVFIFQDEQRYFLNGLQLPTVVFDLFPYLPPPSSLEFEPSELKVNFVLPEKELQLFSISSGVDFNAGLILNLSQNYINGWAESYNGIKGRENHLSLFMADAPGSSWSSALYLNLNLFSPQHHSNHKRQSGFLSAEKRFKTESSRFTLHSDVFYFLEFPLSDEYKIDISQENLERAESKKLFWAGLWARYERKLNLKVFYGGVEGRFRALYHQYSWKNNEKTYYLLGKRYYKISYNGFTESAYLADIKAYLKVESKGFLVEAGGFVGLGSGKLQVGSPFARFSFKEKVGSVNLKGAIAYEPIPIRAFAIAPLRRKDSAFKHYFYNSNSWQFYKEERAPFYEAGEISFAHRKLALVEANFPIFKGEAQVNLSLGALALEEKGFIEDRGIWETVEETKFYYEDKEYKIYRTENLTGYSIESIDALQRHFYGGFISLNGKIRNLSFYSYLSFTRAKGSYDSCLYVPFQEDDYIGFGRSFLMNHPVYDPDKIESLSGDLSFGNGWRAFLFLDYSKDNFSLFVYTALFPKAPENQFVELFGLAPQVVYYPIKRASYKEASRNALGGGFLKIKLQGSYIYLGIESLFKTRQILGVIIGKERLSIIETDKMRLYLALVREF